MSFKNLSSKGDNIINFLAITLAVFGVIMVGSASMEQASVGLALVYRTVGVQIAYLLISLVAMWIISKTFSFKLFQKHFVSIAFLMLGLLISTRFFPMTNGTYAWMHFNIFGFSATFQPSELSKIILILLFAIYLGELKFTKRPYMDYLNPLLLISLIYVFMILLVQKDLGTAIVLAGIGLICFLVPTHRPFLKVQVLISFIIVAVVVAGVFFMSSSGISFLQSVGLKSYQIARFQSAINPFLDQRGDGYQVINSLIAIVKGGVFGVGLGNSTQKYGYVPEVRTDSIFPIIAEELGLFGVSLVFILYGALILRLFYLASRVYDEKAKIVFIGLASYFFIHLVFNIGGITGLIPLPGVPLLLISAGGSSMLSVFMGLGIVQALIKQNGLIKQ